MPKHYFYFVIVLALVTTPFKTYASDILDCVVDKYVQPYNSFAGLPNPAQQGTYNYNVITYGEQPFLFAISKPDLVTSNVSLPHFLSDYSRKQEYKTDAYHNFDSSNLALNAKVWLPHSEQPLPLVLLVHGNSAPGFDYLGELLASRGNVVVQVDQTFLNGLWGENGARAWILLEHLKLIRQWNAEQGHTFYKKLDFEKVALIGMSRGGEAVALAATFNQWQTLPNESELTGFNFNIKSIVALAPIDGQYQHAAGRNILKNVNYLVLQGGHDADVYQFLGSQQWHRTQFDDAGYLKQSIYIYRANHINFNQDMSDDWHWGGSKDFYAKLLTPKQQEQLTKIFVSAFLEVTLKDKNEFRAILSAPTIDEFELPRDIYITRYKTSDFKGLEDFENLTNEDINSKKNYNFKTNIPFSLELERLRGGTKTSNSVLKLALEKNIESRISVKLSSVDILHQKNGIQPLLSFSLARSDGGQKNQCNAYNLFDDTWIEIRDKSGVIFKKPVLTTTTVAPLLISDYSELENGSLSFSPTEPLLQTFTVPIELEKQLSSESELELALIFNPKHPVSILLDDIGITHAN